MAETTGISWTDHTFNPWIGCTKVSTGEQGACEDCYAEALAERYGWAKFGPGEPRHRTAASTRKQPYAWNRRAAQIGERRFVFCLSLGDIWDNEIDPAWRADLFDTIRETPNLVWLALSKRIGNAEKMARDAGGLPSNVALGSTFPNQFEYDRDRMKLKQARETLGALFTFGSFEPLLGPVILDKNAPDWVIAGGESGPSPRPMKHEWVASLRDQSKSLGRAFHFKQWGGRTPKANGKTLDGREWCERPALALAP